MRCHADIFLFSWLTKEKACSFSRRLVKNQFSFSREVTKRETKGMAKLVKQFKDLPKRRIHVVF
jgi:hypothetical protein